MAKTNIDNLTQQIVKSVKEYQTDVNGVLKTESRRVARETVKELKATSPRSESARSGTYANGWTYSKQKKRVGYIVHNKPAYSLAHLLEYGHVKKGGTGRTEAIPHIRPAEQDAMSDFEKSIKEGVSRDS